MTIAPIGAACTAPNTTAATVEAGAQDVSAYSRLLSELTSDVVPLDIALKAFSLAIGPLPDVEFPPGRREEIPSGTGPMMWVLGGWDELTEAQQAAIEGYLDGGSPEASGPQGGPVLAVAAPAAMPSAQEEANDLALLDLIEDLLARLADKLGRPLGVPVELGLAPELVDGDALALAGAVDASGGWQGEMTKCTITLTKSGMKIADQFDGAGVAPAKLQGLLAHELFHCYAHTVGDPANKYSRPPWVAEGLADWAAEAITGGSGLGGWPDWLNLRTRDLFTRTYDALGFWAHVDENSGGLWPSALHLVAVSDQGSNAAYSATLGISTPAMLTTWGPGYFRDPLEAPAWDQDGPGILPIKPTPLDVGVLGPGGKWALDAAPLTATTYLIDLEAEVVTITPPAQGMIRLADGAVLSYPGNGVELVCTKAGGCTCPNDNPGAGSMFRQSAAGEARVGLAGNLGGTETNLVGWDLEDFCEEPPVPECLVGTWFSLSYEVPDQQTIGGLGTWLMTIDASGAAISEFDSAIAVFARVPDPDAPWVKLVFSGRVDFSLNHNATAGEVTGGSAVLSFYAYLEGQWVRGQDTQIVTGFGNPIGSTFLCDGDRLIVRSPTGADFEFGRVDG